MTSYNSLIETIVKHFSNSDKKFITKRIKPITEKLMDLKNYIELCTRIVNSLESKQTKIKLIKELGFLGNDFTDLHAEKIYDALETMLKKFNETSQKGGATQSTGERLIKEALKRGLEEKLGIGNVKMAEIDDQGDETADKISARTQSEGTARVEVNKAEAALTAAAKAAAATPASALTAAPAVKAATPASPLTAAAKAPTAAAPTATGKAEEADEADEADEEEDDPECKTSGSGSFWTTMSLGRLGSIRTMDYKFIKCKIRNGIKNANFNLSVSGDYAPDMAWDWVLFLLFFVSIIPIGGFVANVMIIFYALYRDQGILAIITLITTITSLLTFGADHLGIPFKFFYMLDAIAVNKLQPAHDYNWWNEKAAHISGEIDKLDKKFNEENKKLDDEIANLSGEIAKEEEEESGIEKELGKVEKELEKFEKQKDKVLSEIKRLEIEIEVLEKNESTLTKDERENLIKKKVELEEKKGEMDKINISLDEVLEKKKELTEKKEKLTTLIGKNKIKMKTKEKTKQLKKLEHEKERRQLIKEKEEDEAKAESAKTIELEKASAIEEVAHALEKEKTDEKAEKDAVELTSTQKKQIGFNVNENYKNRFSYKPKEFEITFMKDEIKSLGLSTHMVTEVTKGAGILFVDGILDEGIADDIYRCNVLISDRITSVSFGDSDTAIEFSEFAQPNSLSGWKPLTKIHEDMVTHISGIATAITTAINKIASRPRGYNIDPILISKGNIGQIFSQITETFYATRPEDIIKPVLDRGGTATKEYEGKIKQEIMKKIYLPAIKIIMEMFFIIRTIRPLVITLKPHPHCYKFSPIALFTRKYKLVKEKRHDWVNKVLGSININQKARNNEERHYKRINTSALDINPVGAVATYQYGTHWKPDNQKLLKPTSSKCKSESLFDFIPFPGGPISILESPQDGIKYNIPSSGNHFIKTDKESFDIVKYDFTKKLEIKNDSGRGFPYSLQWFEDHHLSRSNPETRIDTSFDIQTGGGGESDIVSLNKDWEQIEALLNSDREISDREKLVVRKEQIIERISQIKQQTHAPKTSGSSKIGSVDMEKASSALQSKNYLKRGKAQLVHSLRYDFGDDLMPPSMRLFLGKNIEYFSDETRKLLWRDYSIIKCEEIIAMAVTFKLKYFKETRRLVVVFDNVPSNGLIKRGDWVEKIGDVKLNFFLVAQRDALDYLRKGNVNIIDETTSRPSQKKGIGDRWLQKYFPKVGKTPLVRMMLKVMDVLNISISSHGEHFDAGGSEEERKLYINKEVREWFQDEKTLFVHKLLKDNGKLRKWMNKILLYYLAQQQNNTTLVYSTAPSKGKNKNRRKFPMRIETSTLSNKLSGLSLRPRFIHNENRLIVEVYKVIKASEFAWNVRPFDWIDEVEGEKFNLLECFDNIVMNEKSHFQPCASKSNITKGLQKILHGSWASPSDTDKEIKKIVDDAESDLINIIDLFNKIDSELIGKILGNYFAYFGPSFGLIFSREYNRTYKTLTIPKVHGNLGIHLRLTYLPEYNRMVIKVIGSEETARAEGFLFGDYIENVNGKWLNMQEFFKLNDYGNVTLDDLKRVLAKISAMSRKPITEKEKKELLMDEKFDEIQINGSVTTEHATLLLQDITIKHLIDYNLFSPSHINKVNNKLQISYKEDPYGIDEYLDTNGAYYNYTNPYELRREISGSDAMDSTLFDAESGIISKLTSTLQIKEELAKEMLFSSSEENFNNTLDSMARALQKTIFVLEDHTEGIKLHYASAGIDKVKNIEDIYFIHLIRTKSGSDFHPLFHKLITGIYDKFSGEKRLMWNNLFGRLFSNNTISISQQQELRLSDDPAPSDALTKVYVQIQHEIETHKEKYKFTNTPQEDIKTLIEIIEMVATKHDNKLSLAQLLALYDTEPLLTAAASNVGYANVVPLEGVDNLSVGQVHLEVTGPGKVGITLETKNTKNIYVSWVVSDGNFGDYVSAGYILKSIGTLDISAGDDSTGEATSVSGRKARATQAIAHQLAAAEPFTMVFEKKDPYLNFSCERQGEKMIKVSADGSGKLGMSFETAEFSSEKENRHNVNGVLASRKKLGVSFECVYLKSENRMVIEVVKMEPTSRNHAPLMLRDRIETINNISLSMENIFDERNLPYNMVTLENFNKILKKITTKSRRTRHNAAEFSAMFTKAKTEFGSKKKISLQSAIEILNPIMIERLISGNLTNRNKFSVSRHMDATPLSLDINKAPNQPLLVSLGLMYSQAANRMMLKVDKIDTTSSAHGILQVGDLIMALNGKEISIENPWTPAFIGPVPLIASKDLKEIFGRDHTCGGSNSAKACVSSMDPNPMVDKLYKQNIKDGSNLFEILRPQTTAQTGGAATTSSKSGYVICADVEPNSELHSYVKKGDFIIRIVDTNGKPIWSEEKRSTNPHIRVNSVIKKLIREGGQFVMFFRQGNAHAKWESDTWVREEKTKVIRIDSHFEFPTWRQEEKAEIAKWTREHPHSIPPALLRRHAGRLGITFIEGDEYLIVDKVKENSPFFTFIFPKDRVIKVTGQRSAAVDGEPVKLDQEIKRWLRSARHTWEKFSVTLLSPEGDEPAIGQVAPIAELISEPIESFTAKERELHRMGTSLDLLATEERDQRKQITSEIEQAMVVIHKRIGTLEDIQEGELKTNEKSRLELIKRLEAQTRAIAALKRKTTSDPPTNDAVLQKLDAKIKQYDSIVDGMAARASVQHDALGGHLRIIQEEEKRAIALNADLVAMREMVRDQIADNARYAYEREELSRLKTETDLSIEALSVQLNLLQKSTEAILKRKGAGSGDSVEFEEMTAINTAVIEELHEASFSIEDFQQQHSMGLGKGTNIDESEDAVQFTVDVGDIVSVRRENIKLNIDAIALREKIMKDHLEFMELTKAYVDIVAEHQALVETKKDRDAQNHDEQLKLLTSMWDLQTSQGDIFGKFSHIIAQVEEVGGYSMMGSSRHLLDAIGNAQRRVGAPNRNPEGINHLKKIVEMLDTNIDTNKDALNILGDLDVALNSELKARDALGHPIARALEQALRSAAKRKGKVSVTFGRDVPQATQNMPRGVFLNTNLQGGSKHIPLDILRKSNIFKNSKFKESSLDSVKKTIPNLLSYEFLFGDL